METTLSTLPEALLTEILARLPMRSTSRSKSVCKTWKTILSSVYFRRRFLSVHQNSSPSWSLIDTELMEKEVMGSYGCQTWNLPKSPYSYLPWSRSYNLAYSCSSNGLVMMKVIGYASFVGNPVLQKWVKIPKAPYDSLMFGLVTRVDVDGVVLSFKIVELDVKYGFSTCLHVHIYSSETGIWTSNQLHCHINFWSRSSPISVNGTLYLLSRTMCEQSGVVIIAHDFYSETDQCQTIPLPNQYKNIDNYITGYLSTSGSKFLMYMDTFAGNTYDTLKIWKLKNDSTWQVLWELELTLAIGSCAPIAMHPFDSDIVYLSYAKSHLVSYNLRTQKYRILRDISDSDIDDHQNSLMGDIMEYARLPVCNSPIYLSQFVLPRWMESIPCPPQTEIITTTSVFRPISSMHKRKRD